MDQADKIKALLMNDVEIMASHPETFAKESGKNFTRNRKFTIKDILLFPILMERDTVDRELLKYFRHREDTPSSSAYFQRRRDLRADTYHQLLDSFNAHFTPYLYKGQYVLTAVDGSGFNLFYNPKDDTTFIKPHKTSPKGHNEIHVTASYQITDHIFSDAVIQPSPQKNEYSAICELVDRCDTSHGTPIFLADRGFPSFNLFAHCKEKGACFLVRAKDLYIERLLKNDLPTGGGEFDVCIKRIVVRSHSKKTRSLPDHPELYRFVDSNTSFDYISYGGKEEYPIELRVVRIKISDNSYENLITNLPADAFDLAELRFLYYLRWKIELSFRELKHAIGAEDFHARSFEYVTHEIWSRFILYNVCSRISTSVIVQTPGREYIYQVNFTMAIKNTHDFLRQRQDEPPIPILGLIRKYILPVRPGRNFARQHRFHTPMKFTYRH